MCEYESASAFIESATSLQDRIVKIDLIIDGLMTSALAAAENAPISSYSINNGQSTINQSYRSANDVMMSIQAFEKIRTMYINRLNGSAIRLVDKRSNFIC